MDRWWFKVWYWGVFLYLAIAWIGLIESVVRWMSDGILA